MEWRQKKWYLQLFENFLVLLICSLQLLVSVSHFHSVDEDVAVEQGKNYEEFAGIASLVMSRMVVAMVMMRMIMMMLMRLVMKMMKRIVRV